MDVNEELSFDELTQKMDILGVNVQINIRPKVTQRYPRIEVCLFKEGCIVSTFSADTMNGLLSKWNNGINNFETDGNWVKATPKRKRNRSRKNICE